MELAKEKNLIVANSEKKIVYLVNAIAVQKGNPKNIQSLKDLCKDNLKISIANPDNVCVGSYAVEIIEKNLNKQEKEKIRKNIVNYAKSCESTATSISFKTVDAIIGWSAFGDWDPSKIEIIPLKSEEIIRVGYIPIAISKFSKNPENAKKFIDFMLKEKSKEYFRKFGYFMSKEEAFSYIGKKPVGGTYELPNDWK
jgi:molybdate transport system substrate-binding protein